MKRLRIAVLGGGVNSAVGRAHLSALNLSDRWEFELGYFSRDSKTNLESAEAWQVRCLAANFQEFLEKSQKSVDVFLILTPTPNHFAHLRELIPFKIPIICEKSITANYQQGMEIKSLLQIHQTNLYAIFNYTAYPMVREIKERVRRGDLGRVHSFQLQMLQDGYVSLDSSGKRKKIQQWRATDYELPTVSLDLGVHCYNLLEFVLNDEVKELTGVQTSYGNYHNLIDGVLSINRTKQNAIGEIRFGKSFLGKKNDLEFSLYGSLGSVDWSQEWPNEFRLTNKYGETVCKTFASPDLLLANSARYMRFKAGHPFGFIEAFANLYDDIFESIHGRDSEYVFGIEDAVKGLLSLDAIQHSSSGKAWVSLEDFKKE